MGEPAQINKNKKILQKLRGEPAQKNLISFCKVSAKPASSRGADRRSEQRERRATPSPAGQVSAKTAETGGRYSRSRQAFAKFRPSPLRQEGPTGGASNASGGRLHPRLAKFLQRPSSTEMTYQHKIFQGEWNQHKKIIFNSYLKTKENIVNGTTIKWIKSRAIKKIGLLV